MKNEVNVLNLMMPVREIHMKHKTMRMRSVSLNGGLGRLISESAIEQ